MLSPPVTASFNGMVREPLVESGASVEPFIVLSDSQRAHDELTRRIHAAYKPTALIMLTEKPKTPKCRLATFIGHDGYGASAGILQHFAISTCFETVEAEEQRRGGQRYGWVLRMRTDIVLFAPLWLPTRRDRVYTPGGGMSYKGWLRCCNDHMFLCPRALCGPYATLIHNFNNSNCTPLPGYAAGGDGVLADGTIRPQPTRLAFPWHIARAYNATDNRTRHNDNCGRVTELGLVYAIARGSDNARAPGVIDCEQNLRVMWGYHARPLVHNAVRRCADLECARLSRRFHGSKLLNASEISTLTRAVYAAEARQGLHRAAG